MHIEAYRNHCLAKVGTTESFPFDQKTLVFKVMGKMFALTDVDAFTGINLKCDPDRALELREQYTGVEPGYHMSKVHWNTVSTQSDVSDALLLELIDHSYALIRASLTKKLRGELAELEAAQGA